jgi:uncharacterized protein (TIGR03435 family)
MEPRSAIPRPIGILSLIVWMSSVALAQPSTTEPRLEFEVASVKPAEFPNAGFAAGFAAGAGECGGGTLTVSGNRVKVSMASICAVIRLAYDVKGYRVVGTPPAPKTSFRTASDRLAEFFYDIEAKAGGGPVTTDQARAMVRTLLDDRFQLKVHHEMKEMPVYALVTGKNKLKLLPSTPDCRPHPGLQAGITACDWSMDKLVDILTRMTDRPVVDKTGFTGAYQFNMQQPGDDSHAGTPGPSLSTVVEELGLKLVAEKLPIDVLVVDHFEKPSAN